VTAGQYKRRIAVVMVHGIGRANGADLVSGADKRKRAWERLTRSGISIRPFLWSNLTEATIEDLDTGRNTTGEKQAEDGRFLGGAWELQQAMKNAAHLTMTFNRDSRRSAASGLLWRISGGMLDAATVVSAAIAFWAWVVLSSASGWMDALFLLALMVPATMLLLGLASFLISPYGWRAQSFRRSGLLALWPLVLATTSLPRLYFLAFLPVLGWGFNTVLMHHWPATVSWSDGLPMQEYRFRVIGVIVLLISLVGVGLAWIQLGNRLFPGFVALARLTGDIFFYLGNEEHRDRAQRKLWSGLRRIAKEHELIVVGAHSLGSVLTIDTIRRFGMPGVRTRLVVVTGGSPLKRLFHTFFPALYPAPAEIRRELTTAHSGFDWINVYRPKDPVGSTLGIGDDNELNTGQPHGILSAHLGYFLDPVMLKGAFSMIADRVSRPVDQAASQEPPALYPTAGFELPEWISRTRQHERASWWTVTIGAFVMLWLFQMSIENHRDIGFIDNAQTETVAGTLFGRRVYESTGGRDAGWREVEQFWVRFTPSGQRDAVCTSVDTTVDPRKILDAFYSEARTESPGSLVLGSCGDALGKRNVLQREGRAIDVDVTYAVNRPDKALIRGMEPDLWRWVGWVHVLGVSCMVLFVIGGVVRAALHRDSDILECPPNDSKKTNREP